jgi:hypothetical protein
MANRPTQRSMQDLLEKQLVSLNEIHSTLATSKLIELGQLVEEKKTLDDDDILVDELRDLRLISNAILESLIEIKDKFLAMPITTNEDKAETAKSNAAMLKALQDLGKNKDEPLKDIKEGLSLGPIIAGIGLSLGALQGELVAQVKNIKFWLKLFTPELMKKELSEVVKNIRKVFSDLGLKLKEIFDTKLKSLGDFFENSLNKLKSIFKIDDESKISKVFKWLKTGIKNFFAPFQEAYTVIKDLITPAAESKGIFTAISENLGKFAKMFGAVAKIVGKLMLPVTIIMTLWDTVKGAIEGYEKEGVAGAFQGAITGFMNSLVGGLADLIKDMASWLLEKLGFDEASKDLDSFSFQDIIADYYDALFHPIDTIKGMINSVQIALIEGLNSMIDKWNSTVKLDSLKIDKMEVPEKYESDHVRPSVERKEKAEKAEKQDKILKKIDEKPISELSLDALKSRAMILKEKGENWKDNPEMVARFEQLNKGPNAEAITPKTTDDSSNAEAITPNNANIVAAKTTATEEAKENAAQPAGNTVVSAPTVNTSNSTVNSTAVRLPSRNPDGTSSRYISSRYAIN